MTKAAAIYNFWQQFLPAYEENAVPATGDDSPEYPYLTYSFLTNSFGEDTAMSASLWYRGTSWLKCNEMAESIFDKIGEGGIILHHDKGAIWIKRGQPFSQNMSDPGDYLVKRKYLNVTVEYI